MQVRAASISPPTPLGATVYLDTIEAGTSAFTLRDVSPGTHEVLIRKTGYNDYTGSVTVPDEKHAMFEARLTPLGEDPTVAATAAMEEYRGNDNTGQNGHEIGQECHHQHPDPLAGRNPFRVLAG